VLERFGFVIDEFCDMKMQRFFRSSAPIQVTKVIFVKW